MTDLPSLCKATEIMGMSTKLMDHFSQRLMDSFYHPLLQNIRHPIAVKTTLMTARLEYGKRPTDQIQQQQGTRIFMNQNQLLVIFTLTGLLDQCIQICYFVSDQFFKTLEEQQSESGLKAAFEETWAPVFLDAFVTDVLRKNLPEDMSTLEKYQPLMEHVLAFERQLQDLGFFASHRSAITDFVQQVRNIQMQQKRSELLQTVHDILLADDFSTVEVTEMTERGM